MYRHSPTAHSSIFLLSGFELLIEIPGSIAHQHQRLCLGFGLDGGGEVHVEFVIEHVLGHRDGQGGTIGQACGELWEANQGGLRGAARRTSNGA